MITNFIWLDNFNLNSNTDNWQMIANLTDKLFFDLDILTDNWQIVPNYFLTLIHIDRWQMDWNIM